LIWSGRASIHSTIRTYPTSKEVGTVDSRHLSFVLKGDRCAWLAVGSRLGVLSPHVKAAQVSCTRSKIPPYGRPVAVEFLREAAMHGFKRYPGKARAAPVLNDAKTGEIQDEPLSSMYGLDRSRVTHCLRNHLDGLSASRRSAVRPRSRLWAVDGLPGQNRVVEEADHPCSINSSCPPCGPARDCTSSGDTRRRLCFGSSGLRGDV